MGRNDRRRRFIKLSARSARRLGLVAAGIIRAGRRHGQGKRRSGGKGKNESDSNGTKHRAASVVAGQKVTRTLVRGNGQDLSFPNLALRPLLRMARKWRTVSDSLSQTFPASAKRISVNSYSQIAYDMGQRKPITFDAIIGPKFPGFMVGT